MNNLCYKKISQIKIQYNLLFFIIQWPIETKLFNVWTNWSSNWVMWCVRKLWSNYRPRLKYVRNYCYHRRNSLQWRFTCKVLKNLKLKTNSGAFRKWVERFIRINQNIDMKLTWLYNIASQVTTKLHHSKSVSNLIKDCRDCKFNLWY